MGKCKNSQLCLYTGDKHGSLLSWHQSLYGHCSWRSPKATASQQKLPPPSDGIQTWKRCKTQPWWLCSISGPTDTCGFHHHHNAREAERLAPRRALAPLKVTYSFQIFRYYRRSIWGYHAGAVPLTRAAKAKRTFKTWKEERTCQKITQHVPRWPNHFLSKPLFPSHSRSEKGLWPTQFSEACLRYRRLLGTLPLTLSDCSGTLIQRGSGKSHREQVSSPTAARTAQDPGNKGWTLIPGLTQPTSWAFLFLFPSPNCKPACSQALLVRLSTDIRWIQANVNENRLSSLLPLWWLIFFFLMCLLGGVLLLKFEGTVQVTLKRFQSHV